MKRLLGLIVLCTMATGCALNSILPDTNKWIKTGASEEDFNKAKYQCQKENQQGYSSSSISGSSFGNSHSTMGSLGGGSVSGVRTNWDLYRSCLLAQGWSIAPTVADKPVKQIVSEHRRFCVADSKKVGDILTLNQDGSKWTLQEVIGPDNTCKNSKLNIRIKATKLL